MRKNRIERDYSYHIDNLRRYYSNLKINDTDDIKTRAWKLAIYRKKIETDENLMIVIKHVYIIKDYNLAAASLHFLHYEATTARKLIRKWFDDLDRYFFEAVRYV